MVNYACAFSHSESGKYFEWIIITCISVLHHQGPVHTYLFLFESTDIKFYGLAYRSHVSGENGHRKHIFSKTFSRVEIFEKAGF